MLWKVDEERLNLAAAPSLALNKSVPVSIAVSIREGKDMALVTRQVRDQGHESERPAVAVPWGRDTGLDAPSRLAGIGAYPSVLLTQIALLPGWVKLNG